MPGIYCKSGMDLGLALRLFKKQVEKANIVRDIRSHEFYLKPSDRKKLKRKEAGKRRRKQGSYE